MAYELTIFNGKNAYSPAVEGSVVWETERKGSPGKLTFNVIYDKTLEFSEGNAVRFLSDNKKVFFGFIFTKRQSKDGIISVIAYDQLRYFKNKDTYVFKGKTATQIIKKIAKNNRLNTGTLADTKYKFKTRVFDNKTLFDMCQEALEETTRKKGKLYVLYDSYGKLTLKNAANMKVNVSIYAETAEDYSYESSIDKETFNRIKLVYDNKEKNKRDVYMVQSGKNINKWGMLQQYEKIQSTDRAKQKAKTMLKLFNKPTRDLSIKGAFGDYRCRAGKSVPVYLIFNDVKQSGYLLIEKARHVFEKDSHTMDLTLIGGKYF